MYTKKPKPDISIFATENEFHTLLTIHNETKKRIFQLFPHIKNQIIDTLFSILSSQALLYDQIIRKSALLQGSVTKQSQIAKLVQENKNSFENKIHSHLNSLGLPFNQPLNEVKQGHEQEIREIETEACLITNTKSNIGNISADDSLRVEQESIISRIKRKMKMEKPQHIRTNSCYLTTNLFEQEEMKTNEKEEKLKAIIYQKEKLLPKYRKIKLQFEKNNNSIWPTQHNFYQNKQNAHSALLSLTQLRCLTERKSLEKESEIDKKPHVSNILLSYQSFPKNKGKEYQRIGSKPSKYAKHLLKKYQDIVDSYEKIEIDEDDDLKKQNLFQGKLITQNDINKREEINDKSTKSFAIDIHNSSGKKRRLKSNNTSTIQKRGWK